MTSKITQLNRQPIIVRRYCVVPYYGPTGIDSATRLCAPPPPSGYPSTDPLLQAPPAHASEARVAMFDAIGESLLGDEFTDLYDYTWVQ